MSNYITICEVGTRDGFQIEPEFIPTDLKIEAVNRLSATGIPRIEVTSFVHPKVVPQLRDDEEVMARIERRSGTVYAALVPNDKGAQRAIDAGVDKIHTVLSASESHNLANVNMTVAESLARLEAVARVAQESRSYRRTPGRFRFPGYWPGRYDRHGQSRSGAAYASIPDAKIPRYGMDAPHPQYPCHGHPQHPGGGGVRCEALRLIDWGARWLSLRPRCHGQCLHRGSGALSARHGL